MPAPATSSRTSRIALGVEYDGGRYNGWQRQKSGIGVQSLVETALSSVANEAVEVVCAGRTDTGVHAAGQVVHFDTTADRSRRSWLLGVNTNLPDDINATWAQPVDDDFHARYSAVSRAYRYRILNRFARSALERNRSWWIHEPLDEGRMQEGASHLLGEHDFSAFRAAGCQASTPVREIIAIDVSRTGEIVEIVVSGNAFLQHMVRNISGVLATIGKGERAADWARDVLNSRDRTRGGVTAPPQGLVLEVVRYPDRFGIPPNGGTA